MHYLGFRFFCDAEDVDRIFLRDFTIFLVLFLTANLDSAEFSLARKN